MNKITEKSRWNTSLEWRKKRHHL